MTANIRFATFSLRSTREKNFGLEHIVPGASGSALPASVGHGLAVQRQFRNIRIFRTLDRRNGAERNYIMRAFAAVCLSSLWLCAVSGPSYAQDRSWWNDGVFGDRKWDYVPRLPQSESRPIIRERPRVAPDQAVRDEVRDGGVRPEISPKAPAIVGFNYDYPASSIVIDTGGRKLYFVLPDKLAYEYPISVGRDGFNWTGTEKIARKQAWPDWYPPQEMRDRDATLPARMTGGIKNPLGAMALYLGDTLYRIHGTNDVKSIGQAQSSGCFRMLNSAVLHLASVAEIGTPVTVMSSLKGEAHISRAPVQPVVPLAKEHATVPKRAEASPQAATSSDYQSLRAYALERDRSH
jgi:lipoprotein-anchoring transpeptidase ErfK/SrfK